MGKKQAKPELVGVTELYAYRKSHAKDTWKVVVTFRTEDGREVTTSALYAAASIVDAIQLAVSAGPK